MTIYYNNTVNSKKVRCWPINSSLKDAKLLKTQNLVLNLLIPNIFKESKMFFCLKLCIQHPGDISLTQAVIM